jgi:AcrR family transcriptional regulator
MSLRNQKKQATGEQILAASRHLFLDQGFESTTMEQIAEASDVSRATLFNYYPGKKAILLALASSLEARITGLVEHYRNRSDDTADCIEQLFAYSARVLEQTAGLTRLLLTQGGAELPLLRKAFVQLVENGQRAGDIRVDFSAADLAEPVYLAFLAGLLDWCRQPDSTLGEQFAARTRLLGTLLAA